MISDKWQPHWVATQKYHKGNEVVFSSGMRYKEERTVKWIEITWQEYIEPISDKKLKGSQEEWDAAVAN